MNKTTRHKPQDLDIVALLANRDTSHFETGQPIRLLKGQIGTVVMEYDDEALEVEFTNNDGTTFAMETLPLDAVLLLHDELLQTA
ncbi:DUF4926 domain-containing protein [Phormidium yuhuli AB48]|uniref:DUF4926 domain-containing protein n=1 Tax=Phormidium yuhuli AB48 TaxID=2940671 RepID=A0ABY5AKT3_9CYAN|nr:DUF4926 domain-containing protein [Phormidium yuhuli]USR89543.1 DUF4926 domain-containing protein [Phormidium yuhuli AB48]